MNNKNYFVFPPVDTVLTAVMVAALALIGGMAIVVQGATSVLA